MPDLSRRGALRLAAAVAGGLAVRPLWALVEPSWSLDLRAELPEWVSFRRASGASLADADGRIAVVGPSVPRRPLGRDGRPLGLLIEGKTVNLLPDAAAGGFVDAWRTTRQTAIEPAAGLPAPGRAGSVFRVHRPAPKPGCEAACEMPGSESLCGCVASVWLRSVSGRGGWPIGVIDAARGSRVRAVVALGEGWRRVWLPLWPQDGHRGVKRFAVLLNTPTPVSGRPLPINWGVDNDGEALPMLGEALVWGAQAEAGLDASSWVPLGQASREADELSFEAARLSGAEGCLTFRLPEGGLRGATLIDVPGPGGLRLGYSRSGALEARVGAVELRSPASDLASKVVGLEWSRSGLRLLTADPADRLAERAATRKVPPALAPEGRARLGADDDGGRPLNRVLARVDYRPGKSRVAGTKTAAVSFSIPRHTLAFADDFDDADLDRINEQATGGSERAPAWRSRYRHGRAQAINGEKQIYVDPAFAGTGSEPLGLQPFSIAGGVLSIRALPLDAGRSERLWGIRYASGCITSELTHWQTYGYFELRARLPAGRGFWPAFWLLPKRVAWPPEIDILEGSGARPFGVHCGVIEKPRGVPGGGRGQWIDGLIDTTDGFHVYALEWRPDDLLFFVDGRQVFRHGAHGIHEDLYLLVNLALGSKDPNWIPDPDASTDFSQALQVDYVRAYRRAH